MTSLHGPRRVAGGMLRGLRLRCPYCGRGRLIRGYMTLADACSACGRPFLMRQGDFAGAVAIAQFLVGLVVLPVLFIGLLATDLPLDALLVGLLAAVTVFLLAFYRNIKGLWFGFLLTEDERQAEASRRAMAADRPRD